MVNEKEVLAFAGLAIVVGAIWKTRNNSDSLLGPQSATDEIILQKTRELWNSDQTGDYTHFSYFRDRNYATQPLTHQ